MMRWRRIKVPGILIVPVALLGAGAGLAAGGNVGFGAATAAVGLVILAAVFVGPRLRQGDHSEP